MRLNGEAAGAVAAAAARADAAVIQVSTNEVFDGMREGRYREGDAPSPINAYGASKLAGERAVAAANPHHLVVRTAWLFGPDGPSFVTKILAAAERAAAADEPLRVVEDEWGNPTWTPALADAIAELALRGDVPATPVVHVAGTPPVSRLDWARVALDAAGMDVTVEPISRAEFVRDSSPPARAILDTSVAESLGVAPLDWERPLRDHLAALAARPRGTSAS